VGVNFIEREFIIKLDCQNIHDDPKKRLSDTTNEYIKKYSHAYNEAIEYTYGKIKQKKDITYQFVNDLPQNKVVVSKNHRALYGRKTDWSKLNIERSALGKTGEELILKVEQKEIDKVKKNKNKKVEHISQTRGDGLGYDILSYDKNSNPKYIEVKTTNGNIHTPFYLTKTELEISKVKRNYFIYRLYDFNFLKNSEKIQVLDKKAISQLDLEVEVYKTNL